MWKTHIRVQVSETLYPHHLLFSYFILIYFICLDKFCYMYLTIYFHGYVYILQMIQIFLAIFVVTLVYPERVESRKAKIVTTSFVYNGINCRAHSASLTDFGGVGDGNTSNTKAFQSAISHLSQYGSQGGSQLYVPAGKWLTGSFSLTSHFTLYLDRDAVLLASQVSH